MNPLSGPLPSNPPSPPRHKLTDLPSLGDDEVDFAPPEDTGLRARGGLIVDEHTDLSTIPQAQLYDLNQALLEESVGEGPLIGDVQPIASLRAEYKDNKYENFVKQIDWLESQGFRSIRRAKGDGDCFYRSTAFAFVEQILNSADKDLAAGSALSLLDSTLSMLQQVKYDAYVYEGFYEAFVSVINHVAERQDGQTLASRLLKRFQTPEESNSIVGYLRMLTSAKIRIDHDLQEVLVDPDTQEILETREFCERLVDPFGKDADHVQITALCRALQLNMDIAYLDGHLRLDRPVNFVSMGNADGSNTLTLLYRPGHYDILMKGK